MKPSEIVEYTDITLPSIVPPMERAQGVHVSNCLKWRETFGGQKELYEGIELTPDWAAFGKVWETGLISHLQQTYPGRFSHIDPIELDGIHGSPDFGDNLLPAVCECKLKWMSSKRPPTDAKFSAVWQQIMSYCKMWQVNKALLFVGFVKGDYEKPFKGPKHRVFYREFHDWELELNWQLMLQARDELTKAGWV